MWTSTIAAVDSTDWSGLGIGAIPSYNFSPESKCHPKALAAAVGNAAEVKLLDWYPENPDL